MFVVQTIIVQRGTNSKKTQRRPIVRSDWKWAEARGSIPGCLARWPGFALGWVSATGLAYYEKTLEPFGIVAQALSTPQRWACVSCPYHGGRREGSCSNRKVLRRRNEGLLSRSKYKGAKGLPPDAHAIGSSVLISPFRAASLARCRVILKTATRN